jgi:phosphohistidine phosphatase
MRHAKAEKLKNYEAGDIERNLEKSGIKDAAIMGKFLKEKNFIPDLIICSPSTRTRQTLEIALEKINHNIKIAFDEKIYENDDVKILKLISGTENKTNTLMIIGHNPAIEEIASNLTGNKFPIDKFSTSGIAVIEFQIDEWIKILDVKGKLVLFKSPKDD